MQPALGMIEFASIATGIAAGDAMVKRGPVSALFAGTIHPGRYVVMVTGDVAAVEEAMTAGREFDGASILDEVFLPDAHAAVVAAVGGARTALAGEALGVVETSTIAATVRAADAGVKGAAVGLLDVLLADGLGGKGYSLFSGPLPDVEAAVDAAVGGAADGLVGAVVLPNLDSEMAANLIADPRFGVRVGRDPDAAR